jgi:TolB-like protein/mono/diheme cytochrome c family protein
MKKALLFLASLATIMAFAKFTSASAINPPGAIEIPDEIQQIFDNSCYACHSSNSKDSKAKEKLDFDKLNYLKTYQVIGKLDKIAEVVIDDKMPPEKFLKKNPEKALSNSDKELLTDWIRELTEEPKATLDSQLDLLISQIVNSLAQNEKSKIAVMDFVDMQGQVTNLGRYMSEELTTRLYLTGQFEVIERQLLDKIVQEQQISMTGMVDESSAVELGKILGVDAIASGTIGDLGKSVKVNARLISAESGKLFSVASVEIPKTDKVKVLLSESVSNTTTNATTNGATNATMKSKAAASQTINKEGYTFELLGARKEGQTAICKLKITNTTQEDKTLAIHGQNYQRNTEIYTDVGDEVIFSSAKFGNTMKYPDGGFAWVVKKMVGGTSVDMDIYFNNISSNATEINLLEITCGDNEDVSDVFQIKFRDIPLKE